MPVHFATYIPDKGDVIESNGDTITVLGRKDLPTGSSVFDVLLNDEVTDMHIDELTERLNTDQATLHKRKVHNPEGNSE